MEIIFSAGKGNIWFYHATMYLTLALESLVSFSFLLSFLAAFPPATGVEESIGKASTYNVEDG